MDVTPYLEWKKDKEVVIHVKEFVRMLVSQRGYVVIRYSIREVERKAQVGRNGFGLKIQSIVNYMYKIMIA